jgi:D-sedoheptulose 7-phosphate isomerase
MNKLNQDAFKLINKSIEEHIFVMEQLFNDQKIKEIIIEAAGLMSHSVSNGGCIYWCGNGGSAADSQHMAAELVGRFKKNRRPLNSVSLTTDSSVLTCIANDFSYDEIFDRQLEGLGTPDDVLVGISTSGKSKNVNNAFLMAKKIGMKSIAILGKGGGDSVDIANLSIVVPSLTTARIQEAHIFIGHLFCELIEKNLGLE